MHRMIKWLLILVFFLSVIFFYPLIEKNIWYARVAWIDTPIEKISSIGGEPAIYVAEKLLTSEDLMLNNKGLKLCASIASPELVPYIIKFIRTEDKINSEMAISALSAISSEDMVEPLTSITKTADSKTRLGILQVLSQIKGKKDVAPALKAFINDDKWVIRMALADELGFHPNSDSAEILKKLISDDYLEVALTASNTLGNIGDKNEYSDIFSHLKPESSWLDKIRAIRLISLFPEKTVGLMVAMYIGSEFKFLAVAALEWMMAKGDERDFALIVKETGNMPQGVVKTTAIRALAVLAETANKKDQVILNLMKFLKSGDEGIIAASLEGLMFLKAGIAAGDVTRFLDNENMDLSVLAIETLGSFGHAEYLQKIMEYAVCQHSKKRRAAYLALLGYKDLSVDDLLSKIQQSESAEEAEALGLFLFFHAKEKAADILTAQYRNASKRDIKIKLLEMISQVNQKVTNLDLMKLLKQTDLPGWEKAKMVMDNSTLKLNTPAVVDGFLFFLKRQPRNVKYSIMSFTSASESFWDNKDVLYLQGEGGGEIQGVIVYEDYNSYYYATTGTEIIQVSKDLVTGTYFSPIYELLRLRKELDSWQKMFEQAIEQEKWFIAGYVIQKIFVRIEILKSEISLKPVASRGLDLLKERWMKNIGEFKQKLKGAGLVQIANDYVNITEVVSEHLEKLAPEEAEKRKSQAEDKFKESLSLEESGDYTNAIKAFESVLEIWPRHSGALREIGICYAKMEEYGKALEFYTRLKNKRPRDVDILNSMSIIYRLKGDRESALKLLTQEIEADPTAERGRIDAADVLVEMDKIDDATELLTGALNTVKNKFEINLKLAKLYRKTKQLESAVKYMEACLKEKPEDVNALSYAGLIYFTAGKTPEAINVLKKAIAFDLANISARLTLAEIYSSTGQVNDALSELNKILAIDPQNDDAKKMIQNLKK